jgi:glycosyltransferase involved in cell wall biosynthesis
LFVHHDGHLGESPGGVQICTREYLDTLESAGFSVTPVALPYASSLMSRIGRRVYGDPYRDHVDVRAALRLIESAGGGSVRHIFLNQHSLGPLAAPLHRWGKIHVSLLSHGLESVDYLHQLRTAARLGSMGGAARGVAGLGRRLLAETGHNREVDHVFCLAPFEAEIERWLGARRVTWVPRTVVPDALDWSPVAERFGFVGRLDHAPNLEGLLLFLDAFRLVAPSGAHVRLSGAPERIGRDLALRYPFVQFLGTLTDDELRQEASTWVAGLHPLFCYARGCSTKLAVLLGWGIPVVTTRAGSRGYTWRDGVLPTAETPADFADLVVRLLDTATARAARTQVHRVVASSPNRDQVADLVVQALNLKTSPLPRPLASSSVPR